MTKQEVIDDIKRIEDELTQIKNFLFEAQVTTSMMVKVGRELSCRLEVRKDDLKKLEPANG